MQSLSSCRVQLSVIEESTSSGILTRFKKSIKRADAGPASRIVQIDVKSNAVNTIADESLKDAYQANNILKQSLVISNKMSTNANVINSMTVLELVSQQIAMDLTSVGIAVCVNFRLMANFGTLLTAIILKRSFLHHASNSSAAMP